MLIQSLTHNPPQKRALITYIKRIYYPFLLHEPELHSADKALIAGG